MVNWRQEFKVGKYTFSLMEVRDLAISVLVLGFIFSAALDYFQVEQNTAIVNFGIAILIVGPALLFHELGHKIMAQRYGCRAEYVLWPMGVILSVALTIVTAGRVIFAALGAVMISTSYATRLGYRFVGLTTGEIGRVAAVGPGINILIALIAFPFVGLSPNVVQALITINLIVALFNCIPFPPLDGAKIFGWSKGGWFGLVLSAVMLLYLPSVIGAAFAVILTIVVLVVLFIFTELRNPPPYVSTFKMP
jgi:Zn-dependent protease